MNLADVEGQTPLHKVCQHVNYIGGITPHWADEKHHNDVADLLIKHGADMDKADKYGNTPRQYMIWSVTNEEIGDRRRDSQTDDDIERDIVLLEPPSQ